MNVVLYACTKGALLPKKPVLPEAFALVPARNPVGHVFVLQWMPKTACVTAYPHGWVHEAEFKTAVQAIEWIAKQCARDYAVWVTL